MERSYWDIDSMVADCQKVPCTFNLDVPGLGHLEGGTDADLKQGSRLELPFWLAEMMITEENVSMHLPKPFTLRVRAALDAEPTSVNLKNLSTWWYALGLRVDSLTLSLSQVLIKAYLARVARIYATAQHLSSSSLSVFAESSFADGGGGGVSGGAGSAGGALMDSMGLPAGGRAGAGTGGGGGNLSAEMSDFLNGLDESERLLLREANLSNNISRAYFAGRR